MTDFLFNERLQEIDPELLRHVEVTHHACGGPGERYLQVVHRLVVIGVIRPDKFARRTVLVESNPGRAGAEIRKREHDMPPRRPAAAAKAERAIRADVVRQAFVENFIVPPVRVTLVSVLLPQSHRDLHSIIVPVDH